MRLAPETVFWPDLGRLAHAAGQHVVPDIHFKRNAHKVLHKIKALALAPEPDILPGANGFDQFPVRSEALCFVQPAILVTLGKRMVQIAENPPGRTLDIQRLYMDVHGFVLLCVAIAMQHRLLANRYEFFRKGGNPCTSKHIFRIVVDNS